MSSNNAMAIAFAFFATWLCILYAGADHPPPPGFLWLVPLIGACAVVVYLRVQVYASWPGSIGRGRILGVLVDGAVAGIVVGLVALLLPVAEEPTAVSMQLADIMIWLAVLAVVGAANSVLLYTLASVLRRRRY
jgi:hypothetical protein